jgi:hypothetical protein
MTTYILAFVLPFVIPVVLLILSGHATETVREFFQLLKFHPVAASISTSILVFVEFRVAKRFHPDHLQRWLAFPINWPTRCLFMAWRSQCNGKGILSLVFSVSAGAGVWFWKKKRG